MRTKGNTLYVAPSVSKIKPQHSCNLIISPYVKYESRSSSKQFTWTTHVTKLKSQSSKSVGRACRTSNLIPSWLRKNLFLFLRLERTRRGQNDTHTETNTSADLQFLCIVFLILLPLPETHRQCVVTSR